MILSKRLSVFCYRHKYFFCISAIFLSLTTYGAPNETELLNQIQNSPQKCHDSIYFELFKMYRSIDLVKAKYYAYKTFKLSKKHDHALLQSQSCFAIGYVFKKMNEVDSAFHYYLKAITVAEQNNLPGQLVVFFNNVGALHELTNQYDSALHYYTLCYDLAIQLGAYYNQAVAQQNIALVYYHLENHKQALLNLSKAISLNREHGILKGEELNSMLLNAAEIYNAVGDFDRAIGYLKTVEENCQTDCSLYTLSRLNYEFGLYYLDRKVDHQAREFFLKSLSVSRQAANHRITAHSLYQLAMLETKGASYARAAEYLSEAEKVAVEIHSRRLLRDIYQKLSEIYSVTGMEGEAIRFQKLYWEMREGIFNEAIVNNIRETEMTLVRKESEQVIQEKNEKIYSWYIIAAMTGLICLVSFSIIYLILKSLKAYRKRKQKLENEVIRRTFELLDTNRELNRIQLEFNHIMYRTNEYLRPPLNTLKGLVQVAQYGDMDEHQLRECIKKMANLSGDFDLIANLLTELYNIKDLNVKPSKVNLAMLADNLYENLKKPEDSVKTSITVNANQDLQTDKDLLVKLLNSSVLYFSENLDERSVNISFLQNGKNTSIHVSVEGGSIHHTMGKESMYHLFVAQMTAFKLKGYILLAEDDKNSSLRIIIPNDVTIPTGDFSRAKQILMT